MKKFIWLTAALALTLTAFTGCGAEKTPEFTEQYQLTTMVIPLTTSTQSGSITVPAKFNPATGSLTPLCSDPVCSHGKDIGCPFAGLSVIGPEPTYDQGVYYYTRMTDGNLQNAAVVGVELATNSSQEIFRLGEIYNYLPEEGMETGSEGWSMRHGYLWGVVRGKDNREAVAELRMRLSDRKVEVFDSLGFRIAGRYGESYILTKSNELQTAHWIADDVDGTNKRMIIEEKMIGISFDDLMDEGILLYAELPKDEKGKYDWEHMILRAYDLNTGEDTVLMDPFPDVYIAAEGGYIYYILYMEDAPLLGIDENSDKEKYNRSAGILWRTHIETGETEKVFTEVEYSLDGVDIEAVGQYIIIGYTNVDYDNPTVTEDPHYGTFYDYPKESGRIVYDTVTGEHKIYVEGEVVNHSVTTYGG